VQNIFFIQRSDGWPQPLTLSQLMPPDLDPGRALELGRQGKSPAERSGQRAVVTPETGWKHLGVSLKGYDV
jgi:hypothetical protein